MDAKNRLIKTDTLTPKRLASFDSTSCVPGATRLERIKFLSVSATCARRVIGSTASNSGKEVPVRASGFWIWFI